MTIPAYLLRLRALSLIRSGHGLVEKDCPACNATGWKCAESLLICELCNGFLTVPGPLADWYIAGQPEKIFDYASDAGHGFVWGRGQWDSHDGERVGRLAETPYRVLDRNHLARTA